MVGDFNVVRNNMEKRGGFFGWDPFWENMERILDEWDLLDIKPPKRQKGKDTWSNMSLGLGYIAARLDCFLTP
jgi:hypothetical protein